MMQQINHALTLSAGVDNGRDLVYNDINGSIGLAAKSWIDTVNKI